MRFKQANDYFREQWNAIPEDVTKTDKGLLKQMLNNTIESYKSQNISDLDRYYFAFVDCIENVFPDEPWYENIGLDIRMDLFNTRSAEETAQHILDAITDADAYVEENKILTEDTVKKQNGKWTNRGDDGKEHGEFKTKKEADAQRKAMFANGYKVESSSETKKLKDNRIKEIDNKIREKVMNIKSLIGDYAQSGQFYSHSWTWRDQHGWQRFFSIPVPSYLDRFDYESYKKEIGKVLPQARIEANEEDNEIIVDVTSYYPKDVKVSKPDSLDESANPENAEINKIIYDVATGKSKAIQKLKKLGYEVEIDDKARKEFGRKFFGDTIRITNPETGNSIVGNTGTREYGYVSGDFLRANSKYGKSHTLKQGKYNKEVTANEKDFDYKTFLDKKHDEPSSKETTISQFKKDKQFINDNQNLYKRLQDADSRLSDIRDRLASRKVSESYDEPEAPGKGYTAPVVSDYTRDIKEAVLWLKDNPNDDMATKKLSDIALLLRQEYRNLRDFNEYWTKRYAAMAKFLNEQMSKIPEEFR